MSSKEPLHLGPSSFMEALDSPAREGRASEDDREEEEGRGKEVPSPNEGSSTDESEDDSEPEPPPMVRRKVSFADAFGLNLVSVKEFHNVDLTKRLEVAATSRLEVRELEEYFLSCLFSVPSCSEALKQKLQEQKVELESISLLPGTSTLRGTVRVVNLCFSKTVYARVSLDGWESHFDLLAEYIPGSSDGETDGFSFKLTLVPPFHREGARVEFCLRYETPVGSFWASNGGMNYVLFCHQRVKEPREGGQEENSHRYKRSCLKSNSRKCSAEEKPVEIPSPSPVPDDADSTTPGAEDVERHTLDNAEATCEECNQKFMVNSQRRRQKVERLARIQDYFSQRQQEIENRKPKINSLTDRRAGKPHQLSSLICLPYRKPTREAAPQVITYHQIPLLTLDWSRDRGLRSGCPEVNHNWKRAVPLVSSYTSEKMDNMSVCDVWKAFLNDTKDNSCVPESEWLQSAASVCPSNNKEAQGIKRRRGVALLYEEQPVKSQYITSRRDNNVARHDPAPKSEGRPVTDTVQEFASVLTRGSADRLGEGHRHKQGKGGHGGEDKLTYHKAEEVSSSGESGTTDVGELANAEAAADSTSLGTRRDETFSPVVEKGVMSEGHKAADDTVMFTETDREEIVNGVRCVLVPHSYGDEDGFIEKQKEDSRSSQTYTPVECCLETRELKISGIEDVSIRHIRPYEHKFRYKQTEGKTEVQGITGRGEETSGQNRREEGTLRLNLRETGFDREQKTVEAGEGRHVTVGEREEEEGSLEKRNKKEVRELLEESESTLAERGEVSADVEDEHVGVENEKLSEGTKEPIVEDDRISVDSRGELEEEERLTGMESLSERMLAEVQGYQKVIEQTCDERAKGRTEEMSSSLSHESQASHDFKQGRAETLSDEELNEADSSPGAEPLVVVHSDFVLTLKEDRGQFLPPPQPPLTSTPPAREVEGKEQVVSIRRSSTPNTAPLVGQLNFSHISPLPSPPTSERVDDAVESALTQWGVVFSQGRVTRALVYALLVALFLVTTLLYNFPACFALYALSLCWWCSQSEKQRATGTRGIERGDGEGQ